jgi:hypothetical protein
MLNNETFCSFRSFMFEKNGEEHCKSMLRLLFLSDMEAFLLPRTVLD